MEDTISIKEDVAKHSKITNNGRMYLKTEDFFKLKHIKKFINDIYDSEIYKEILKEIKKENEK